MTLRILRYDIRHGIRSNAWKYLLITGVLVFSLVPFLSYTKTYSISHVGIQQLTLGDVLFYLMHGDKPYHPDVSFEFSLPQITFLLQAGFHFILGWYPVQEFGQFGMQVIIRSGSRKKWWIGKCGFCIVALVFYEGLIIGTACFGTLLAGGSFSLEAHGEWIKALYLVNSPPSILPSGKLLLLTLLLPSVVSFALGIWQMALSLVFHPFYIYLVVMGYLYFSTYFTRWYLIGNYAMTLRSNYVLAADQESVQSEWGLPICLCLIATGLFFGFSVTERHETIQQAEED